MQELNRQMMTLPELRELEKIIRFGTGPAAVSGVSGVHRAMLGAALRQETKRPLAVLCADEQEARRMAADLAALTGEECVTLFAREWQLRDRVSASHSFEQERLDALCRMAFGRTGIVVATVDGMMQRTLPPTALRDAVLTLRLGEEHDLRALAEAGVEIMSCGTCLNHYGIADQLAVGDVTNMYVIVEKQLKAGVTVRP